MWNRIIVTCQQLAPARTLFQFFVRRAAGVSNCSGRSSSRRPRRCRGAQRRSNPWPQASRGAARSHAQDAPRRPSMASGVDRSEHPGSPLVCAKDRHPKIPCSEASGVNTQSARGRKKGRDDAGMSGTRTSTIQPMLTLHAPLSRASTDRDPARGDGGDVRRGTAARPTNPSGQPAWRARAIHGSRWSARHDGRARLA